MRLRRLLPLLVLPACHSGDQTFPDNFLWGTAIAGFQVEMGCPTIPAAQCEDQNSDWYQWITDPRILADPFAVNFFGGPPSTGPGFFELYPQDLARAKSLHVGAVRLSIEWSRIFPTTTVGTSGYTALKEIASPDGIAFYHSVFAQMKSLGLKPLVTLDHYTLPLWIHNGADCHFDYESDPSSCPQAGWLDSGTITEAAKYAGFVAQEYGGEVDLWATENEPLAIPLAGYLEAGAQRTNPPGFDFKGAEAKAVTMALIQAHAAMYDAVKANDTVDADGDGVAASVGLVYNMGPVQPADPTNGEDVAAATNTFYLYDQLFLDATIEGMLDANASGESSQVHQANLAGRMDYLGINYYSMIQVAGLTTSILPDFSPLLTIDPTSSETTVNNWYPRGIYEMVTWAWGRYHIPIIITENGSTTANTSATQSEAMVQFLQWLHQAIAEGADVRGYFWWTLMDNYEWNHGMAPDEKFGLYDVEPTDPTKARTIRPVATEYAGIAENNGLSASLIKAYPIQAP